jgi:hypothetical protein
MGLRVFAPVLDGVQELGVHSSQASQVLGVDLVGLAFVGVDEPYLPGVGNQDLVTALLEYPARPRRVGAGLDRYAHGPLGDEASSEGLGAGA